MHNTSRTSCTFFLVDEKVLQRLDEAFRRSATASGYLPQATFVRDVMGEAAPPKLSEVSGMVVLEVPDLCVCLICVVGGGNGRWCRWVWCKKGVWVPGVRWVWCKKGVWVLGCSARWVCAVCKKGVWVPAARWV